MESIGDNEVRTIIQAMQKLQQLGFKNIVYVGIAIEYPLYKIIERLQWKRLPLDSIDVVSAGERDPDADGVEGMSASKMSLPSKEILIPSGVAVHPKTCKKNVHKSKTRNGHYRRRCPRIKCF